MKLLITLDFPPEIGGIQKYLYSIVKHTYTQSDKIIIGVDKMVKPFINIGLPCQCAYHSFFLSPLNKKFSLIAMLIPYLKICLKYRRSLCIECGNVYAALIPWLFLPVLKIPYALYTYGTELINIHTKSVRSILLKSIILHAHHVYTLTDYSKTLISSINAYSIIHKMSPRIELPPFGVHLHTKIKPVQHPHILTVGRLVPHKGHALLIKAIHFLSDNIPLSATIIGNGPQYAPLQKLLVDYKLHEKISILQKVNQEGLHNEFCRATIFIFPSLEIKNGVEGFGIVLLEAMAYKIPIIASNSGGISEVLAYGECGLLVSPGDVFGLMNAIETIIYKRISISSMVKKAYDRLQSNYIWNS